MTWRPFYSRACFDLAPLFGSRAYFVGFYLVAFLSYYGQNTPSYQIMGFAHCFDTRDSSAFGLVVVRFAHLTLVFISRAEGPSSDPFGIASRHPFGVTVQNKRSEGPFILKSIMGPKDPLCDTYTKSNMRVHSWTLILRYFGYFILGIRGPKDRSEQIIKRSIHGPFYYLRY